MQRAEMGPRIVAIIIDGIILGLIMGVLFSFSRDVGGFLGFLVGLVYNWFFWTRRGGQTPGKQLMNLRVVKEDGSPLTDTDAILRFIGYYINSFVLMIGWIWAFFDEKQQGWHDKIAKTLVVKA